MSQPAKLQEPTMEEILASIRRIIAEDDLRPTPPPPAPAKPTPAESAPAEAALAGSALIPATAEHAPREEMADGFDDPEMSDIAANDVFEQRESPWRPGEEVAAAGETREPTTPDSDLDARKPVASLDPPRFAVPAESPPPESAPPPRFELFRSEVAKAEFAAIELARSEFVRAEAAKSDFARADHVRSDARKPELPRFELPRPDAARREPSRPDPLKPEAVLRAGGEDGLLSPRTTAAVDLAFNTLAQTVLVQNSRTLEDLVREMLKPMLKTWLDDNLPGLVERLIRAEIERVSRGRS